MYAFAEIIEDLEERAAIGYYDGALSFYAAGQQACRFITAKYGAHLRPPLLDWLKNEKQRSIRDTRDGMDIPY